MAFKVIVLVAFVAVCAIAAEAGVIQNEDSKVAAAVPPPAPEGGVREKKAILYNAYPYPAGYSAGYYGGAYPYAAYSYQYQDDGKYWPGKYDKISYPYYPSYKYAYPGYGYYNPYSYYGYY